VDVDAGMRSRAVLAVDVRHEQYAALRLSRGSRQRTEPDHVGRHPPAGLWSVGALTEGRRLVRMARSQVGRSHESPTRSRAPAGCSVVAVRWHRVGPYRTTPSWLVACESGSTSAERSPMPW